MSRHGARQGSNGCWECAAGDRGGNATFRRTSSLRLRGECHLPHRAPLGASPSITEHPARGTGARSHVRPLRQRSFSLNTSSSKVATPMSGYRTCPSSYMDSPSVGDAATPPGSPEDLPDDDSLHSYSSNMTVNSIDAGYAPYNGTTFSGKSKRYILHCSSHAGLTGDEYLTPTQRAQKQIRRLKNLLAIARKDLDKKDSEIFQLTKEVVELKLYKASLCSPDDKSNSSEMVTIRENDEHAPETQHGDYDVTDAAYKQTPTRSHASDMHSSFTDSGHFDDSNASIHSKETPKDCVEDERRKLIEHYEKKIEVLIRSHAEETQDMKKVHNDRVEALLHKLADVNSLYGTMLPNYESARERIHALEKQLEDLSKQLAEEETNHRAAYLAVYNKGMEAVKLENGEKEVEAGPASRVSMSQLLEQLQITQTELENVRDTEYHPGRATPHARTMLSAKEAVSLWVLGARKAMYRRLVEAQTALGSRSGVDPEVTLQFLKSAVYYFLTDPDHHEGHLAAIESILGFSDQEKATIRKARASL